MISQSPRAKHVAHALLARVALDPSLRRDRLQDSIDQTAREKLLKLVESKVNYGILEGLKSVGMSDEQARSAMADSHF